MVGRNSWRVSLILAAAAACMYEKGAAGRKAWLGTYAEECGEKAQRSIEALMKANFAEPHMQLLRMVYAKFLTSIPLPYSNYDLVGLYLAACLLGRLNVLRKRANPNLVGGTPN